MTLRFPEFNCDNMGDMDATPLHTLESSDESSDNDADLELDIDPPDVVIDRHADLLRDLAQQSASTKKALEELKKHPPNLCTIDNNWNTYITEVNNVGRTEVEMKELLEEEVPMHLAGHWPTRREKAQLRRLKYNQTAAERTRALELLAAKDVIIKHAVECLRRWKVRKARLDAGAVARVQLMNGRPVEDGPHKRAFDNVQIAKELVKAIRSHVRKMNRILKT